MTDKLASKRRCLITNVDCNTATEYAHVFGRALAANDELMTKLEYSWKKKWRTQNINTRYNIFRLSSKFHRIFDAKKWLLLPETRILDQYKEVLDEPDLFPTIKERTYRYTLVAHPDMKSVPIHRRDETLPISPNAFQKYVHPFEGFPKIVSHVHPRFVICNAAQKLGSLKVLDAFAGGEAGGLRSALLKVSHIYERWSNVELPDDFCQERNVLNVQARITIDRQGKGNGPYAEQSDEEGMGPLAPGITIAATSSCRSVRAYSVANETPGRRARDSDLEKAKGRVDMVAAKRCLLENTDEVNALDYAHVLDRGSSDETLTALEYSWGMDHMTLNVDSRYNMFCLNRTFHRLFDENGWLLIPEEAIMNEYHEDYVVRKRKKIPSLENHQPPYNYTLVANLMMAEVPIHLQRRKEEANDNQSNNEVDFNLEDAFVCHILPFQGLPAIKSHVHPRFVICNSGRKLKKSLLRADEYETVNFPHRDALRRIVDIYESWIEPGIIPAKFIDAVPQAKPSDNWPDDKTEPRRSRYPLRSLTDGKRITSPLFGDAPSKPSKRAKSGGANDSAWLDDATLAELERDHSPKKTWHDKVAWIQSWVGQVPMDATVEEVPMDIEVVDKLACQTFDECASDSEDTESLLSA